MLAQSRMGSPETYGPGAISALILGALLLSACAGGSTGVAGADRTPAGADLETAGADPAPSGDVSSPQPIASEPLSAETQADPGLTPMTLRGWLSIVWNEQAHFFLTADDGTTIELDLPEELTAPLGGPLALDRTRVVVVVEALPGSSAVLPVLSITPEGDD